jgi:hypothetical protein
MACIHGKGDNTLEISFKPLLIISSWPALQSLHQSARPVLSRQFPLLDAQTGTNLQKTTQWGRVEGALTRVAAVLQERQVVDLHVPHVPAGGTTGQHHARIMDKCCSLQVRACSWAATNDKSTCCGDNNPEGSRS